MPSAPSVRISLRSQRAQHLSPLQRHGLGHQQRHLVAARRGHERQRDARVAAGGLDQFLTRRQHPALFRVPDHRRADAALHRIRRIAPFDLGQHRHRQPAGHTVQPHQRSAPDTEGIVGVNRHQISQFAHVARLRFLPAPRHLREGGLIQHRGDSRVHSLPQIREACVRAALRRSCLLPCNAAPGPR